MAIAHFGELHEKRVIMQVNLEPTGCKLTYNWLLQIYFPWWFQKFSKLLTLKTNVVNSVLVFEFYNLF